MQAAKYEVEQRHTGRPFPQAAVEIIVFNLKAVQSLVGTQVNVLVSESSMGF